jgi:hypothetical protein
MTSARREHNIKLIVPAFSIVICKAMCGYLRFVSLFDDDDRFGVFYCQFIGCFVVPHSLLFFHIVYSHRRETLRVFVLSVMIDEFILHKTAVSSLAHIEALALRLDAASRAHRDIMSTAQSAVATLRLINDTPSPHVVFSDVKVASPSRQTDLWVTASLTRAAANLLTSMEDQQRRIETALQQSSGRLRQQCTRVDQFRALSKVLLKAFDAGDPSVLQNSPAESSSSLYTMELRKELRKRQAAQLHARRSHVAELAAVAAGEKPLFYLDDDANGSRAGGDVLQQLDAQMTDLLRSLQGNLHHLRRQRAAVADAIDQSLECLIETTTDVA